MKAARLFVILLVLVALLPEGCELKKVKKSSKSKKKKKSSKAAAATKQTRIQGDDAKLQVCINYCTPAQHEHTHTHSKHERLIVNVNVVTLPVSTVASTSSAFD